MPPRVARNSVQGSKPSTSRAGGRNPKKAQKRALNAFSIASHEHADRIKIRKNRLGEIDPSFHRKRPRNESGDEDEDDDEEPSEPKRRKQLGDDVEEGSDSEGNTWTMGHVDDDDDEEIDSDEAFGESDEERFADFTFRGSAQNQKGKMAIKPKTRAVPTDDSEGDFDLDEGESADGEEDEDDDLGEDAIDLATALDQWEEDEAEERQKKEKKKKKASAFDSDDNSSSEGGGPGSDDQSDFSSEEDEGEADRRAQLQNLISSLPNQGEARSRNKKVEVHESSAPDEFGVSRKVDLLSFKPKVADEERKKALKLLRDDKPSKRNDIARKLDAPLPKRQQDKIDRTAANTETNETLDRWTDTIKQNRRAEHLSFPLQHQDSGKSMGEDRLLPTTGEAPANDLESAIQSILQQSGLSNGRDDEEQIQKWEELQTNKLPLEEVMKRRAELRRERELLFREEVRAKRIKKIKSKAYRRVHRKERERLMERERDALKADGVDVSEDEREYNDRRRAEERMGAKHRESKWAKGVKATGRAAWDADALAGVTEMAKRNEELRRRIEGKAVRDSDDEGSDVPSSDESSEDDDEEAGNEVLQRQLSKLKQNPFSADNSKLGQMAFMQKAEAARRAQNDEAIESMRRELAGDDSVSDEENENATRLGRRKFGPGGIVATPAIQIKSSEFEEVPISDEETENTTNTAVSVASRGSHKDKSLQGATNGFANTIRRGSKMDDAPEAPVGSQNPYLMKAKKEKRTENDSAVGAFLDEMIAAPQEKSKSKSKPAAKPQESSVDEFLQQRVSAPDNEGWATVLNDDEDDEDDHEGLENEGVDLDVVLRNQQLTAKGFAGDDVLAEFESEKKATMEEEDAQEITNVLPGWGAWTGDNLTVAEKKRKGLKTVTKREGIDPTLRKDAKLDRVIINEKRMKPNVKYMASQLPFPFETREQYERSLRVPKGKEWTTKKTFQDATKPRVIVKQGIIKPMRKPMV